MKGFSTDVITIPIVTVVRRKEGRKRGRQKEKRMSEKLNERE
jgi:hypothetical protein